MYYTKKWRRREAFRGNDITAQCEQSVSRLLLLLILLLLLMLWLLLLPYPPVCVPSKQHWRGWSLRSWQHSKQTWSLFAFVFSRPSISLHHFSVRLLLTLCSDSQQINNIHTIMYVIQACSSIPLLLDGIYHLMDGTFFPPVSSQMKRQIVGIIAASHSHSHPHPHLLLGVFAVCIFVCDCEKANRDWQNTNEINRQKIRRKQLWVEEIWYALNLYGFSHRVCDGESERGRA